MWPGILSDLLLRGSTDSPMWRIPTKDWGNPEEAVSAFDSGEEERKEETENGKGSELLLKRQDLCLLWILHFGISSISVTLYMPWWVCRSQRTVSRCPGSPSTMCILEASNSDVQVWTQVPFNPCHPVYPILTIFSKLLLNKRELEDTKPLLIFNSESYSFHKHYNQFLHILEVFPCNINMYSFYANSFWQQ